MTTYPIVAMHFYPPAKAIISGISPGTILTLIAEPSNQYDPNAIMVRIKSENIQEQDHDNLRSELEKFGHDLDEFLTQSSWQIGYIPKEIAKILRESNLIPSDTEIDGEFNLNFSGKPLISLDI